MIHSHAMTIALAEQRRSQLEAEAARHRLVQDARRARRTGTRPGPQRLRARALDLVTRLEVRLSNMRGDRATTSEPALRAGPTQDVIDLTANATAELAELVDARSDGHSRIARCG